MHQAEAFHSESDSIADALRDLGVSTIFCITGAGNIALLDALSRAGRFKLVFMHHEQAVVMAASGYARVTGKLGVAIVTTGGGVANAFTGILSAHMDSVPLLVIGGNESSRNINEMTGFRAVGVQGFDAVTVFNDATKLSHRVLEPGLSRERMLRAAEVALEGRQGPVFLEVPMDVQRMPSPDTSSDHRAPELGGQPPREGEVTVALSRDVSELVAAIRSASRPLMYFGAGVRASRASVSVERLLGLAPIPFLLSWSAIDLFGETHPLNVGRAGIYGDRAANIAVQRCDLLICVGTRLAIPQVGYDRNDFARNAAIWVVDVDGRELSKHPARVRGVEADAKVFLSEVSRQLANENLPSWSEWSDEIGTIWASFPRRDQVGPMVDPTRYVHSYDVVKQLSELLPDDAIVVTDVGAGLLTGHYGWEVKRGQRVFTSQGLGEMGFGLAGAVGAAVAAPTRPVVCLNTDGGVMFNLQELQTLTTYELPVKLVVFNNAGYGMIRASQDTLLDGRRLGVDPRTGVGFPDFEKVAECFNMSFLRCSREQDLDVCLAEMIHASDPFLLEIVMDPEQKYLPKVATIRLPDGSLMSPPIEDMDPRIPASQLSSWL